MVLLRLLVLLLLLLLLLTSLGVRVQLVLLVIVFVVVTFLTISIVLVHIHDHLGISIEYCKFVATFYLVLILVTALCITMKTNNDDGQVLLRPSVPWRCVTSAVS